MSEESTYGQFCPVAQASEVVAERWTPLVLRELLCGSRRFNEVHRGVPRMSPSLLSKRLRGLRRAGLVERCELDDGGTGYRLTPAGEALRPVVEALGTWGKRWLRPGVRRDDLDASLLMWDLRRRVRGDALPDHRVVVHFRFRGAEKGKRRWWLVLEPGEQPDLCLHDPGYGVNLTVDADLATFTEVWLGDLPLAEALDRDDGSAVELTGPTHLRRAFPSWLRLSLFAGVERGDRPATEPAG